MVKEKYQSVLDLGEKLNIKGGDVKVVDGKLHISGTADNPYYKDQLWDEIKKVGGENPTDVMADIKVADSSIYTTHEVQKGESLSVISKKYYGDPMKYKQIFEANTDKLKNPDMIHPGQVLIIPTK